MSSSNSRVHKATTPLIVLGSLFAALGLTAIGDTHAQANLSGSAERTRADGNENDGQLRVLDWALWNISKYYVEPSRIDPRAMTLAGLEALESAIPAVLVEHVEETDRIRVRVGTAEREFPGQVTALWAVGPHLREAFTFVEANADLDAEDRQKAEYAVVEGLLGTLDPHTNLLRPEDFESMKATTKGSFGGLGIEVGQRDGLLTVLRILDGNPAQDAGLSAGDRIIQIDEESTVAMTLNDAVTRLRGAPGTTVAVYVRRDGVAKPIRLDITRAVIKLDSVKAATFPATDANGRKATVGFVQIPRNFSQTTAKELLAKLNEFEKSEVSGLVLDMRSNPGGLLTAAVEVADAFLGSGTIVSTVGASNSREENKADKRYDFPNVPLVVLVNQASASATEIVAGALKNHDRALIIGRRTFGKGSVQVLHDRRVNDKELALKLTTAQYLTPGDVSIQSVGVSTDLETIPVEIGKENISFFGRKRFDILREESLAAHLDHSSARRERSAKGTLYFATKSSLGGLSHDQLKARYAERKVSEEALTYLADPEIRIALDLVSWMPSPRRDVSLASIGEFLDEQTDKQNQRIAKALSERDIDWSRGDAPAEGQAATLQVATKTDRPGNVIRGGEIGNLTVSVTNTGSAPAYRVRAISDSDYNYFDERELFFGKIEPGKTRTATLKLSVSEHELSRTDRIDFHFSELHRASVSSASQTSIDVSAQGLARPLFAYGYQVLDDPALGEGIVGNGDGALQVDEKAKLRVEVRNIGEGAALDTWVHLRNFFGETIFLESGREQIGKIEPGKSGVALFDFSVKKGREVPELQLGVSDNKMGEVLSEKIALPVHDQSPDFGGEPGSVSTSAPLDLFADIYDEAQVVARAPAGARLKTRGIANGWTRVDLGDRMAFAQLGAASLGSRAKRSDPVTSVLSVSPPRIALVGAVTQTEGEVVHLSGLASDEDALRDVFVTVVNRSRDPFGGPQKVFYQAASDPSAGKLEFAADVPLTPGNNLIEIFARENEEVVGVHRLWVLRTSGLAQARAKAASYDAGGKTAVDTFRH
ncbi:MAG: PDZ domain-containing protein [Myxococcales bacterium FL481]|nr:MAG: PDZ domain-containing protein [Myxococcales bacterium FL481]